VIVTKNLLQILFICWFAVFQGESVDHFPTATPETTPCPIVTLDAQRLAAITLRQHEENGELYTSIESSFMPAMLDYLNAGGSPADLQADLIVQPVLFEGKWHTEQLEDSTHAVLVSADLDSDGLSEVITLLSIYFGAGYEGYVFVLHCADGQYHAETIGNVIGLVNREEDAPQLETVSDLNDDGKLEIVVSHYMNWSGTQRWRIYSYDISGLASDTAQIPDDEDIEVEMILIPSPIDLP
jgi:hypothetical protein